MKNYSIELSAGYGGAEAELIFKASGSSEEMGSLWRTIHRLVEGTLEEEPIDIEFEVIDLEGDITKDTTEEASEQQSEVPFDQAEVGGLVGDGGRKDSDSIRKGKGVV